MGTENMFTQDKRYKVKTTRRHAISPLWFTPKRQGDTGFLTHLLPLGTARSLETTNPLTSHKKKKQRAWAADCLTPQHPDGEEQHLTSNLCPWIPASDVFSDRLLPRDKVNALHWLTLSTVLQIAIPPITREEDHPSRPLPTQRESKASQTAWKHQDRPWSHHHKGVKGANVPRPVYIRDGRAQKWHLKMSFNFILRSSSL